MRSWRRRALAAGLAAVCAAAGGARAAASEACVKSYERAQEHRLEGRLRAAQQQLLECAQVACPSFIRNDCTRWLAEVQAAQPTVVFVARREGRDLDAVTVTCNQQAVTARLDGRAIAVDPGKQSCRFEAVGAAPATVSLLVIEGQKNRIVEVDLQAQAAAPPVVVTRPVSEARDGPGGVPRVVPLLLAGVGVAGVAGFVALGLSGLGEERRLRDECAPMCPSDDVDSVRLRYRLADVSLGIGLLSAAAAGFLYWQSRDDHPVDVALTVGPRSGALLLGSSF